MCNKAVHNYAYVLRFFLDCSKTQEMCNKPVNTSSAIKFFPECYKTQEICDKAVDTCPFVFKACVRYFLSNLYFLPNDSPSKTMKNVFLSHLKSSFRSWDIQIFVFPSSPLFLPVSHCFRGWSKINLKVYDVINYINKNLMTHFVWILRRTEGMILKLCLLIEY